MGVDKKIKRPGKSSKEKRKEEKRKEFTWAAARRQASVSQTLGASWVLVLGNKAARTTIMTSRIRMNTNRRPRIKSPSEVTPKRPPAF